MKFIGVIATDKVDSEGERFANLDQLAETAVGKPVTLQFEREIGTVQGAKVLDGGMVEVEGILDPGKWQGLYAVPGFIVLKSHVEDGVKVYDDCKMFSVGLTSRPADPYLTPIETEE